MGEPDTSRQFHSWPLWIFLCQRPQNTRSCLTNRLECPQITLQHVPQSITMFQCSVLFNSCWPQSACTVSQYSHCLSSNLDGFHRIWYIQLDTTTLTRGLGVDCIPSPALCICIQTWRSFFEVRHTEMDKLQCAGCLYHPFRRRVGELLDGTWCAISLFVSRLFHPS